jgi:hypothetical protein
VKITGGSVMPEHTKKSSRKSTTQSDPEALRNALDGVIATLESLSGRTDNSRWFPHGITKISAELKIPSVDVSLSITGPDAEPKEEERLTYSMFDDSTVPVETLRQAPAMRYFASAPEEGGSADQAKLNGGKTVEGAAKIFSKSCDGGDTYDNNCAHFLSNALIDAGFADLRQANSCITARCATPAKRVIRARDMWCWFKSVATTSGAAVARNTGFWAVFQLDEAQYWGGHVAIIDSNAWKYYGTGWYENWQQYSYQW